MTPIEIQCLVLKAQSGDRLSMELLCEFMYPRFRRYASKVCADDELSVEAVQDVLLKLSSKLYSLQDPAAFYTWSFRLLRNRCLDLLKSSYWQKTERLACEEKRSQQFTQELTEDKWQLGRYLMGLAQEDRDTLYFFYLEECSVEDISQITQVPIGTVKSRLFRARQQLKVLIEQSDDIECNSGGKDEKY